MSLHNFTTAQLIEELARRANKRTTRRPKHWCEDCAHFITWLDGKTPEKTMPDDYNPCTKGHTMQFIAPEEVSDEYGHYLTVCADRDMKLTFESERE